MTTSTTPDSRLRIRRADERGDGGASWLKSKHTFSFANYYDRDWMGFRSLRVINDDHVLAGAGFPTHGHQDMEILTWPLEGAIEHKDSTGAGSVIRPGMMQAMSAGRGVTHSEFNHSKEDGLHFLQIWIMPKSMGGEAGYQEFDYTEELADRWRLVASPDGADGSLTILADDRVYAARPADGTSICFKSEEGRGVWVHVAKGKAIVNGHEVSAGDALFSDDVDAIDAVGVDQAELLLFDLA